MEEEEEEERGRRGGREESRRDWAAPSGREPRTRCAALPPSLPWPSPAVSGAPWPSKPWLVAVVLLVAAREEERERVTGGGPEAAEEAAVAPAGDGDARDGVRSLFLPPWGPDPKPVDGAREAAAAAAAAAAAVELRAPVAAAPSVETAART